MRRWAVPLLLVASLGLTPAAARADGDPGSDVLVYQPLFLASDAGVPVAEQVRLDGLLESAARAGFPVRVALIASPQDLGAVTGLWLKPQAYARFLGLELSLAYRGRLVVVMPNGLGFNWSGHSTAAGYRTLAPISVKVGLADAATRAVSALAAARGVRLSAPAATAPQPGSASTPSTARRSNTDATVALIAAVLIALAVVALLVRRSGRHRRVRWRAVLPRPTLPVAVGTGVVVVAGAAIAAIALSAGSSQAPGQTLANNPNLDPGTPLARRAPDFTLTDQFGRQVSLHSFRGKVVLLAFNDSECATICPLTTTAMLDAQAMLGRAASRVQLLGVDANPTATSIVDVQSYSQLHGMLHAWHFLTGSLAQLRRVWRAYSIGVAISQRTIDHTPALFMIDPRGRLARLYITQQSYAAVGQLSQLLAIDASHLLPGHPRVNARLSYALIPGVSPARFVSLPGAGGGTVEAGPGRARLYLFFASWDQQITPLAGGLEGLGRYGAVAARAGLPQLEAIDEGSVEPPGALGNLLRTLPPLRYPVAVDRDGRLADGYEVQGLPWLMLVTASGHIAWYYSVGALGWPSTTTLIADVREALARAARAPGSLAAALAGLKGSPAPLAELHRQAAKLLGSEPALAARIRALKGYPIVLNVWASWCPPCRAEFSLFASASARLGRQVAFLGADTNDSAGDAAAFLAQHPVSYPSYQASRTNLTSIVPGGVLGYPTTVFISRTGKVAYVHTAQYVSQGTLDGDIASYALGG